MKRIESQFSVERLFVLGAGASFSASKVNNNKLINRQAPLDADFCKRICDVSYKRPAWVSKSCGIIKDKWIDEKPFEEYGLEEAISRQLGHIDFLNAVYLQRSRTAIKSFDYLNHLTHLIMFILNKVHERRDRPYKTFVDKVFPNTFDECKDRVITFNYDDLLDKYLLERFEKEQLYFDAITGSNRRPPIRKTWRRTQYDFPLLLKLHGSINWRCNVDDFNRIIETEHNRKDDPHIHIWQSDRPTQPNDAIAPLVVPPLPAKPLSSIGIFRWLWTKAFEYLRQADEIIICGYSLPEIDQFARSLFSNFPSTRLTKVTIVDPNPIIMGKWRDIFNRSNLPSVRWEWVDDFTTYVFQRLK